MKKYFICKNRSVPQYINNNYNINIIKIDYNKSYCLIIDSNYLRNIKLNKINNDLKYYEDLLLLYFLNKYTEEINYDQYNDIFDFL